MLLVYTIVQTSSIKQYAVCFSAFSIIHIYQVFIYLAESWEIIIMAMPRSSPCLAKHRLLQL